MCGMTLKKQNKIKLKNQKKVVYNDCGSEVIVTNLFGK
jgi:hypothetical protein